MTSDRKDADCSSTTLRVDRVSDCFDRNDAADESILEIADAEIDLDHLMQRMRRRIAARTELPPLLLPPSQLRQQHEAVLESLQVLRARAACYGTISTNKGRWLGGVELFVKRALRKLLRRHMDQQSEVTWTTLAALEQVASYQAGLLAYLDRLVDCFDRQGRFLCDHLQHDRGAEPTLGETRSGGIIATGGKLKRFSVSTSAKP